MTMICYNYYESITNVLLCTMIILLRLIHEASLEMCDEFSHSRGGGM